MWETKKILTVVKPEGSEGTMRFVLVAWIPIALLLTSCGDTGFSEEFSQPAPEYQLISLGPWSVQHDPLDATVMKSELVFVSTEESASGNEVDSLNFISSLPDSLQFNREWHVGGSSVLLFSVTIPDRGDEQLVRRAGEVCSTASIIRPDGLRSVFLSDRTGAEIDLERASTAVEPPPDITHHIMVYFQQDSSRSRLEINDSLVVDFRGSNADSVVFTFIHRDASSVISSTAGIFRRASSLNQYLCFADSSGLYTGVFHNRFEINIPYLDSRGRVSVQSRLTSAYLSGDAYYPISVVPENYIVQMFLPDSISSWTPLTRGESPDEWFSNPGGIVGGLPIAIGNYSEKTLFPRYKMLILEGSPISAIDSIAVEKIASVLRNTLDFPSAEFAFVEIINPDGPVVTTAFGGMLFSRGSLETLADVSAWGENLANGIVPAGSNILIEAAEGILLQSLQLDPVLSDMLAAWVPLRYFAENSEDESHAAFMRNAYLKYYLYNTANLGGDGSTPVVAEYALGDPMLNDSPIRRFVVGGKGVIVLEYLYSSRMLNRLPYLLQDFTHASSGNFWLKISSSLRVYRDTEKYDALRALFYQPGIPQIHVKWWEEDEKILMDLVEFQPGLAFNLNFSQCELHFSDTTVTRTLMPSIEPGLIQCTSGLPEHGPVTAIDLNHACIIPVDLMYERVLDGGQ